MPKKAPNPAQDPYLIHDSDTPRALFPFRPTVGAILAATTVAAAVVLFLGQDQPQGYQSKIAKLAAQDGYKISFPGDSAAYHDENEGVSSDLSVTVFTIDEKGCVIPDVEANTITKVAKQAVSATYQPETYDVLGLKPDWQIEGFSTAAPNVSTTYPNYSIARSPGYIQPEPTCGPQSKGYQAFIADNPQRADNWGSLDTIQPVGPWAIVGTSPKPWTTEQFKLVMQGIAGTPAVLA
jgi:hypothetical protein